MAAVLQSLSRTVTAGFVLLALILLLVTLTGAPIAFDGAYWAFLVRYLHILSGVMWIGLLWYLNFVQIPTVPKIEPAEHKAAITKFILPNVLIWFRYGALATVVTGLLLAHMNAYLGDALTFHRNAISIWPNQNKVMGMVAANADEKAKAGRTAMLASRTNTLLSIPMLYCMAAQSHGGF